MESDGLNLAIIAFCIIMSAYFSAAETAFSEINRIRVKTMADDGNKRAALVYRLTENIDRLLLTILIGNGIVNTVGSILTAALFIRHFGGTGIILSIAVVTVVTLVFIEISPKALAKESPESFAMFSAPLMNMIRIILSPLNFLFTLWKKLLSKMFKSTDNRSMTDEELITLVEEAEHEGGIDEQESELIRNAIEFNEMLAEDVLTPRVDIEAIAEDYTREETRKIFVESGYSRLPVYRKTIDNIIGILHQKDFYTYPEADIKDLMKKPVYASPTMPVGALLKLLQQKKSHIAVVTDEYGGTAGIITMEDILEELVGEIWDEHDEVVVEFQKTSENTWKVLCSAPVDEMEDNLGIKLETDAATVGGWAIEMLEKVPEEGDSFEYKNLKVTVSKTEDRRLLEVIIEVGFTAEDTEEENG